MKIIIILFFSFFGFISFAQEENTSQIEPVIMTLEKQSIPFQINSTTTSADHIVDNNDLKLPYVNITAIKSAVEQGKKATSLSMADDKTRQSKLSETNKVSFVVERSLKPQTLSTTAIKADQ